LSNCTSIDNLIATQNMPDIKTPISPIVHDIDFINRRLEKAQYFFSDIKKQGIVLYDSGQLKLKEPRELSGMATLIRTHRLQ